MKERVHPFRNAHVVFTGKLKTMTRANASQKVIACGGICKNSVTKATDFLVIGDESLRKGIFYSRKMQTAERLINEGYPIEVISERDFLRMMNKR